MFVLAPHEMAWVSERPHFQVRGVETLTSHSPMAIFSRAQFATPVSHMTKDNILNTLNKVGVNFQRTKKSYALFWFSEPFA